MTVNLGLSLFRTEIELYLPLTGQKYTASSGPATGNAIGLLLALTYTTTYVPPPPPGTGNPIGLTLVFTYP